MRKLIGIACKFQCRVDLLAIEAAIVEIPHLPGAFLEVIRWSRTEAFFADSRRKRVPVELGITKALLRSATIDAAHAKLGFDARGPVAFADARPDEALDKTILVEKAVFLQTIQNVTDYRRSEFAIGKLSLELESRVLAPCEQIHRAAATGLVVVCGVANRFRLA